MTALSCNIDEGKREANYKTDTSKHTQKTTREFEPDLWKADSIQIIYYDDPDGDSLRYSRFFSYNAINDTGKINIILKEFDQSFAKQDHKRDCRSEGKLFLLNGEDVLKTVYFSTRSDSCSYLYFIKDGSFIYLPLSIQVKNFLNNNKKLAKKPGKNNTN
jgi:hypothetical protein